MSSAPDKRGLPGGRVYLMAQLARLAGCDASQLEIERQELIPNGKVRTFWRVRDDRPEEVW